MAIACCQQQAKLLAFLLAASRTPTTTEEAKKRQGGEGPRGTHRYLRQAYNASEMLEKFAFLTYYSER
jgi:hypothetical protein